MQIRSKYKDFYDYVAHVYGGGDPKNVYVRDHVVPPRWVEWCSEWQEAFYDVVGISLRDLNVKEDYDRGDGYSQEFGHISIAGKLYEVTRERKDGYSDYLAPQPGDATPWRIAMQSDRFLRTEKVLSKYGYERETEHLRQALEHNSPIAVGREERALVQISKQVNAPVFRLSWDGTWGKGLRVYGYCPLLKDFGIASVLPAEQCYQEIAMFLNVLTEPPDNMPPAPMTDIQKVESHGFDKRQSFRHRK
jgi:hypothetical protein